MLLKKQIIFFLIVLVSVVAFSFDLSFYNSFETLMMGNTFTGIANDVNAVYYNPAGLTNSSGFVFDIPNVNVNASYGIGSSVVKALTHLNEIKTVLDSKNNAYIADYFLKNYGQALLNTNRAVVGTNGYVGYDGENFALGVSAFSQAYVQTFVSNDIIPSVSLHAKAAAYVEGVGALAFKISNVKFSFGGTYRYGYVMPQIYSINNLSLLVVASSSTALNPNLTYEATSNIDLGLKVSVDHVNFGGLWHNVTNSSTPDLRIGTGLVTRNLAIGVDFDKLLDNRYSFFRRLHIGVKYTPFDFVKLYGGLSAGWFVGGAELKLGFIKFYGGTYVMNTGFHAGYGYQRMYTIGFGL